MIVQFYSNTRSKTNIFLPCWYLRLLPSQNQWQQLRPRTNEQHRFDNKTNGYTEQQRMHLLISFRYSHVNNPIQHLTPMFR